MTAHVVLQRYRPLAPATTSVTIVRDVIRDSIGFQGLLMTDDINMGALSGTLAERCSASLAAGCDLVLHCSGEMAEMAAIAAAVPVLAGAAARRAEAALASKQRRCRRSCHSARQILRSDGRCLGARRGNGMNAEMSAEFAVRRAAPERATDEPALMVDVEGFEGPLDLLLTLARQQKVDLAKISILALADQYLAFVEAARKLRLELAADYLVMAAWLAYLKSRLLLPEQPPPDGISAEDMANALALRLRRLEAIRAFCRAVAQPAAARPRDFCPRSAAADRGDQAPAMVGDALRPALGLRGAAADPGPGLRAHAQTHGVVARRSARNARTPRRPSRSTGVRSTTTSPRI